ncbi:hypothetical protein [Ralstonia pseudosolanacearum]|uniref:Uncharacterized protein n=1 Tax=Ralstonia solanacearum TaxID=305 RepID=A0AA92IGE8_RALSL|nr:hypothetical protein [Ralstonia pseudosolanacearum]QCX51843.1 hypothetical protein E7Z57_22900 [Ralstonia pseudosolanacearum]
MEQERRWRALGAIVIPALSGLLAGCASDKVTGPGALRDTWSKQLEQYGIYAVFPPRADIQVGDIYLTCTSTIAQKFDPSNDAARRLLPSPIWVASIPGMLDGKTEGMLSTLYRTRLQLPRMPIPTDAADAAPEPVTASTTVATSAAATATAHSTQGHGKTLHVTSSAAARATQSTASADTIFMGRPLSTVMPVSFPEFFSAAGTKADAQAIVPLPTILANLGIHASAVDAVQISVPSAESYGLPAVTIVQALADWPAKKPSGRSEIASLQQIGKPLREAGAAKQWCTLGQPQYVVVSEIFATRSINVSMSFSRSASVGAGVGLNLPTGSKNAAVWDALSQYFVPQKPGTGGTSSSADAKTGTAGTSQTQTAPPTIDQATAFVKELNALYSKMGGDQALSYPGGQVTVVTANSAGVNMNRKFEVPVVIGYRGIPLRLEAFDSFLQSGGAITATGTDIIHVPDAPAMIIKTMGAASDMGPVQIVAPPNK